MSPASPTAQTTIICAWCNREKGHSHYAIGAPLPWAFQTDASHGICQECRQALLTHFSTHKASDYSQ